MKIFCILSDERVYGSKSPAMFSKVLQRIGMQGVYVPFKIDPANVGQALHSLKVLNIAGANVTVPYKEKVIPYLDELSEGANIIGAINTIVCNRDTLKGYNTNAIGFMDALNDADFEVAGKSALVFGTGGAARAVVFMLNWLRAGTIRVAGRSPDKAAEIANRFEVKACSIDEHHGTAGDGKHCSQCDFGIQSPGSSGIGGKGSKVAAAGLSAGDRSELRPQPEFLAGYGPA